MDLWVIWILVAATFAIGEILSLSFFLAPFAGGALLAAAVDGLGAPDFASIAVFLVASTLFFGFLRPIAMGHLRTPPSIRTGTQALIGRTVTVMQPIDNAADTGTVKLAGEIWTARSYMDGEAFPAGTRVDVIEIKGATAFVTE